MIYNDVDVKVCAWLRRLIFEGHLPSGRVIQGDLRHIGPSDCEPTSHFFAGIGGWPLALRMAGWPDDCPVWTGSCPCQPFSVAGKQKGTADERHLWPEWLRLIRECRPPTIFGEQVASPAGRRWLAGVQTDLEALGYRFGAADLCAAGVGAPHIRQRLFWVADTGCERRGKRGTESRKNQSEENSHNQRRCENGWVGDSVSSRLQGWDQHRDSSDECIAGQAGMVGSWSDYDLVHCYDGKARRIEPGTFPLAHGVPGRVGLLRGYGNAIVPQVAATFIRAVIEASR